MPPPDLPTLLPADPGANYLAHKEEIDEALRRVLEGGWYVLGPEVAAFEGEYAHYLGARHALGVASGRRFLEGRWYKVLVLVCAVILFVLAGVFLALAVEKTRAVLGTAS